MGSRLYRNCAGYGGINDGRQRTVCMMRNILRAQRVQNTPNAQLKGVKKVFLRRGEKKHITLHLKEEDFGLYQNRFSEISENGSYRIWQLPFRSLVRFFV